MRWFLNVCMDIFVLLVLWLPGGNTWFLMSMAIIVFLIAIEGCEVCDKFGERTCHLIVTPVLHWSRQDCIAIIYINTIYVLFLHHWKILA